MFDRDNWGTLLIRWLMLAVSVWVAAEIVSGIYLEGIVSTLVVAAVLGLLNLYLRPILVFFALPFTVVTLGLFIIVITDWLVDIFGGIEFGVDGIGAALLGALIISLVNMLLSMVLKPRAV
jgi:putative membrane protein